jgi:hypothetical protein
MILVSPISNFQCFVPVPLALVLSAEGHRIFYGVYMSWQVTSFHPIVQAITLRQPKQLRWLWHTPTSHLLFDCSALLSQTSLVLLIFGSRHFLRIELFTNRYTLSPRMTT